MSRSVKLDGGRTLVRRQHQRFDGQRPAILAARAELLGYRLAYGDDPAEAATFFRSLLSRESAVEV